MSFIINPDDKFYPQANEWMWSYCTFLGKFTDKEGINYDLGVYIDTGVFVHSPRNVCDATVHSNTPGDYTSGDFERFPISEDDRDWKQEVYKRAKILNLIK